MSFFDKLKRKKQEPQVQANPDRPVAVRVALKIWKVAFACLKIGLGAALTVAMIFVVCMFVFVSIVAGYLEDDILPNASISLGDHAMEQKSYLYYVDDGKLVMYQNVYTSINREFAAYDEIPQNMVNAAIAIEDHRFYEHQGVDWITTSKAIVRMFFGNDDAGGSSITQQLVKNVTQESGVTVQRKVLEIFKAFELEKNYTKEEIMERYLNEIYLGQSCYGVRTAAAVYFGKELEKLTLAECASIISITNAPTFYDPYQNFDNNKDRKENVLWAMRQYDMITEEEYQAALSQQLVLKRGIDLKDTIYPCKNDGCGYRDTVSTLKKQGGKYYCPKCGSEIIVDDDDSNDVYSWYTDTVLEDVAMALAEQDGMEWNSTTKKIYRNQVQTGGYHIYTCLDPDVQAQVDKIYTDLSQIPRDRSGQQLQSAIVIKDNTSGDVVAMAGGVGQKKEFDEWNRATEARLQSGSSIKPITVYAPGFESGKITPASAARDLPLNYNVMARGPYPKNDNRVYNYSNTIYGGVTKSTNAIAAQTLELIGIDYSFDFAKDKFGISTLVDQYTNTSGKNLTDRGVAALAMGAQTWGVHVRDMADAFGTFANKGYYVDGRTFTKVYDTDGNLVLDNTREEVQILSEKSVDYMNYCLVNATMNGTGKEANLFYTQGVTTAGKTGTTASSKDRWYCGFTAYYTAAVWVGYDSPEVIRLVNGGNPASQLFKKVMGPLHKGKKDVKLFDESKMETVTVCLDSGLLASKACSADVRGVARVASAKVYPEDKPTKYCDKHVSVSYCYTGGGVANQYCKKFAAAGGAKVGGGSLVKLTQEEVDYIRYGAGSGLAAAHATDKFIYLVDANGNNAKFRGIQGNRNYGGPYVSCSKHNANSWANYTPAPKPPEGGGENTGGNTGGETGGNTGGESGGNTGGNTGGGGESGGGGGGDTGGGGDITLH